ncbi:MAG: HNH endonuclease [Phycisphaerae bacterium]|nr:HNH endonuclease [Phycisphaerae bacterium]
MVSQEDFGRLNQHKWHATSKDNRKFYASRMRYTGGKKNIQMHREIMQPADELVVDHIDGNGLNNTRENLRIVTAAQNCYNQRKCRSRRSSKYKGVSLRKRDKKWTAAIMFQGVLINLGFFAKEIDAAKAYDEAAKELFREYAKLNFE